MADVTEVAVPDIGDFSDVPVVEVLVATGDQVAAADPLLVLESDKASMEIPAPEAGTVQELKVQVGDTVSEGDVLLTLAPADGAVASSPEDGMKAEAATAEPIERAIQAEASAPAPDGEQAAEAAPAPEAEPAPKGDGPPYASPSVRRRARELGIDLTTVSGTGRKGRITAEDLERPAAGAPAPAGAEERVPLGRIQRLAAANLAEAWRTIPHVTHHDEADITELEAFRKRLNAEQSDVKVTMVALLLKACAATLDAFPRFASSLDGEDLVVKPQRHLGFAADTPNGLVVPVIRDVDRKGILELAGELTELSERARAGRLGPKEMSGAVFTISSLGGIGGTGFTPIVNPPQVAILGVVRAATRPLWDGTEFIPRLVLPVSLSYDHRVIDGAAAARFCMHLKGVLEDLRRVLL